MAITPEAQALADVLGRDDLIRGWQEQQRAGRVLRVGLTSDGEAAEQTHRFATLLRTAVLEDGIEFRGPAFNDVRQMLEELSASRARQGYTPTETAMFVLALRDPLLATLIEHGGDVRKGATLLRDASRLLDALALFTTEAFQRTREQIIVRQQQEMLELSTPVVSLWEGIVAVPLIGTLDSARTQVVMEGLLQRIVDTGAALAVIDITGVPTVDTVTAQHLLRTVAAARLMGADCIISGIRPQIAQTIVHLGVDLGNVTTKATLADAFALALRRSGLVVRRIDEEPRPAARTPPQET